MARIVFNFGDGPPSPGQHGLAGRLAARLAIALAIAFAAGLGGCAWLDAQQRQIALRPTPGAPANFTGLRATDQSFATLVPGSSPGTTESVQMWWLPHANTRAPTLLYLHGTFRNLYGNVEKIDALRDAGFSVLAVDYRGWGGSSPIVPAEATIHADANVAWAELARREADPRKRVIYGHSMGSGVAVELASRLHHGTDYAALILESAFTSLPDVASASGFLGWLAARFMSLQFNSIAKIAQVDAPVLMLHGSADKTVPVALGRRLRDAAPPGTVWVEIEGGSHSRLQQDAPAAYQQALKMLLDQLG